MIDHIVHLADDLSLSASRHGKLRLLRWKYSLLHATYQSGATAIGVRSSWMASADFPERVEHIFSSDRDDEISQSFAEIRSSLVNPSIPSVSAVRNWNEAAKAAIGDLLVVIADDLMPCAGWDTLLDDVLVDLDPSRTAFVVKIAELENRDDLLLRHPVISRKYYERFGLWNSEYHGHYVDHDFTYAAYHHGLVLDGRRVRVTQLNAAYGQDVPLTASQVRMAAESAIDGRALFEKRWPQRRRRVTKRYFRPRPGLRRVPEWRRLGRIGLAKLGYLKGGIPRSLRTRYQAGSGLVKRAP